MRSIKWLVVSAVMATNLCASNVAHAGIPVIDVANLAQSIEEVIAWAKQFEQMVQQIQQQQQQFNALTGSRNLGDILNNPAFKQIVPGDLAGVYNGISTGGFSGMTTAAKAIRSTNKIYNCADRTGSDKLSCETVLSLNSQGQANNQQALQIATQRTDQIQSLQSQINATNDPKSIAELQARISAENAQVANDANRIALMQYQEQLQRDAAEQARREKTLERLSPTAPKSITTLDLSLP